MIDRAIEFATKAHEGQFRKGTRRPYIVHPIEVGDIVSTMTTDEEVISAAVTSIRISMGRGIAKRRMNKSLAIGCDFVSARNGSVRRAPKEVISQNGPRRKADVGHPCAQRADFANPS